MRKLLAFLNLRPKTADTSDQDGYVDLQTAMEREETRSGPMLTHHQSDSNPLRSNYAASRVLIVILSVSMTMNLMLILAIIELTPLHTVMPYLVQFSDGSNQIVTIAPPTSNMNSMQIISDRELREYMTMRYTIAADKATNAYNWNTRIPALSSTMVMNGFKTEIAENMSLEGTGDTANTTQSIVIRSLIRLRPNTYHIDFDLDQHQKSAGLSDSSDRELHYTAELTIGYTTRRLPKASLSLNPFGFVVLAYSVGPRKT